MKILQIVSLLLAIGTTIICGCTGDERSVFYNIDSSGWVYGDTLDFRVSDSDTTLLETGDIMVVVRHSNAYEYANIWLTVRYSTGDTIVNDTVNVRLADDFGNWYGKGMGISYQHTDTLARHVTMDLSHPIKVWHIMRADTIPDIEQVGVIFNN